MSFLEHLDELRDRLIKSLVALAITTAISLLFTNKILEILKSRVEGIQLIRTQLAEMIAAYFKVALISGVVLAMPFIVYQGVMFVLPAVTPKEKRVLLMMLPGVTVSFVVGVAFTFFVLLPPALSFLIHFGEDIAAPLIKVGDYVSVVASLMLWIGLAFETPILVFFLAYLGVVTPRMLSMNRRYAYLGAFVLAAVITPTVDPVNQSLVALPLFILYEVSIFLAKLAQRGRASS